MDRLIAAHRELGEDLHQRARVVLGEERRQRGPVRRRSARAATRAAPTSTNRVTALDRSCTSGREHRQAVPGRRAADASAASSSPSADPAGGLGVGRERHPLPARAGWPPATAGTVPPPAGDRRPSSRRRARCPPARAARTRSAAGSRPRISTSPPPARSSTVAVTMPSTDDSIGTTPARPRPVRTAARVAPTDGHGTGCTSSRAWRAGQARHRRLGKRSFGPEIGIAHSPIMP